MDFNLQVFSATDYLTANFSTVQAFASARVYHLQPLPPGERQIKLECDMRSAVFALQMLQKQVITYRFPGQQLRISVVADDDFVGLNAIFAAVLAVNVPVRYSLFCVEKNGCCGAFYYKTREFELEGDEGQEVLNAQQSAGNICHGVVGSALEQWQVGADFEKTELVHNTERRLVELLQGLYESSE